jgi:hypothetical protein
MADIHILSFPAPRVVRSAPDEGSRKARSSSARLREAAEIVETVAYEEAGAQPTGLVSHLIIIAAEIERLAKAIEETDRVSEPASEAD